MKTGANHPSSQIPAYPCYPCVLITAFPLTLKREISVTFRITLVLGEIKHNERTRENYTELNDKVHKYESF